MKKDQISTKESAYLVYAYISISTFVLMAISNITESLAKALYFNPTVSLIIVLNLIVFISLHFYKKKHISHENQNHY
jgi:hypothetical protein